jgi:peroxiredoxin
LPRVALPATTGGDVDLGAVTGVLVLFVYPWTGRPDLPNPPHWDDIPGAHGSTPEAEGFAALADRFAARGARVVGLSTQDRAHQSELAARLRLPYPLVSDADWRLADALSLPRFSTGGVPYLKRLTMVAADGRLLRTFYPVHPPHTHAAELLSWLAAAVPQSTSLSTSSTE